MTKSLIIALLALPLSGFAELSPLQWAQKVADNIVDNTRFEFELQMQPTYPDLEAIDFGAGMPHASGVAYALTEINSEVQQDARFQIGRTGSVKIWLDDRLVFERIGSKELPIRFDEKSYLLDEEFNMPLNKGKHRLLVKSEGKGGTPWQLLLQSDNMSRYAEKGMKIECSLSELAPKVEYSNWLILGVFDGDIQTVCPPERQIELYRLYQSGGRSFTWNIPRINLLIENSEGKSFYWSYHVGGFVWSLQKLGVVTNKEKYTDYASRWCDYALFTVPIVEYQTRTLHAVRSMNFGQANRPMLDYYSAPAMPYVTRLSLQSQFPEKDLYTERARKVIHYLRNEQFRIDGIFARSYTKYPSVWADDMFMGLPYLVYWAKITPDKEERETLQNDASGQILTFNRLLFDPTTRLYRQACYPSRPQEKVPFWSRGNGWAVWATCEVLEALPKNHKNYKPILTLYRKHMDGLLAQQDNDGFWRNVLDMPASVRESSGAAMFVYSLARGLNNGWLPRKGEYQEALLKGWKALLTFVDEKGDFNGVKAGTNFSTDPMDYERVRFIKSDTHGLLPFVFACIEMDKFLSKP